MSKETVIAITQFGPIKFSDIDRAIAAEGLVGPDDIIYNGFEHFYLAASPTKLEVICDRLGLHRPETITDGTRESSMEVWNLIITVSKTSEEVSAVNRGNRPPVSGDDQRPAQKGRSVKYEDNMVITVKIGENPKKGTAKARFALYQTGMTVAEYLAAGGKRPDISWDAKQGWIEVAVPTS